VDQRGGNYPYYQRGMAGQHQQLHQKLESTLARLYHWGRKKFGVLPKRIKEAQNELQHIIENNANGDLMDNVRKK
jgi:hypothetical protein